MLLACVCQTGVHCYVHGVEEYNSFIVSHDKTFLFVFGLINHLRQNEGIWPHSIAK